MPLALEHAEHKGQVVVAALLWLHSRLGGRQMLCGCSKEVRTQWWSNDNVKLIFPFHRGKLV